MDLEKYEIYQLGTVCASIGILNQFVQAHTEPPPKYIQTFCDQMNIIAGQLTLRLYGRDDVESVMFATGAITVVCEKLYEGKPLTGEDVDHYSEATHCFVELANHFKQEIGEDTRVLQ